MENERLSSLSPGDKIRVTLSDGTELVGKLQNEPDVGPPLTAGGRAAGWDEKATVAAVEVVGHNDTDYETFDLWSERRGDEWTDPEGRAFYYVGDDYEQDTLLVEEVEEVGDA